MTKRVLLAAGLAAVLAGSGTMAAADAAQRAPGLPGAPGSPGPGPRRGGAAADMLGLQSIELTDAQKEQVRSIMESHKAESDEVRTTLRDAHRAFAEAANASPLDEAAVRARSSAIAAAMADEAILRVKVRSEVHAILTPEQQEQLKQLRQSGPRRRPEL
jgi:protein CpxP